MIIALSLYLVACLCIFIAWLCYGLYEDLHAKHVDYKFGYNVYDPHLKKLTLFTNARVWLWVGVLISFPFINIFVFASYLVVTLRHANARNKYKYKQK